MGTLELDGFVLLKGALAPALVDALRGECERAMARTSRPRARVPLEQVRRRPFADPSLLALAGSGRIRDLWIRCARPGSRQQRIHRDASVSSQPMEWMSADILLSPFSGANGATEIWPGSHLVTDVGAADRARTEERAAARSSVVVVGEPGDVLVRNPMLWHRAGANRTAECRTMLSVEYACLS